MTRSCIPDIYRTIDAYHGDGRHSMQLPLSLRLGLLRGQRPNNSRDQHLPGDHLEGAGTGIRGTGTPALLCVHQHQCRSHGGVGRRKPETAAFEEVVAAIGVHPGLRPRSIVFFDNVAENVEAARASGPQAMHVRTPADIRQLVSSPGRQGTTDMAKVLGTGGVFFKSPGPAAIAHRYGRWLGGEMGEGFTGCAFQDAAVSPAGYTVWSDPNDNEIELWQPPA